MTKFKDLEQKNIKQMGLTKHQRYLWFCVHCNHAGFSHHSRAQNHLWNKHKNKLNVENKKLLAYKARQDTDDEDVDKMKSSLLRFNTIEQHSRIVKKMLNDIKEDYQVQKEITEKIKSICKGIPNFNFKND